MRARLDTNPVISYLSSNERRASAIGAILTFTAAGAFRLLFPPQVAEEIAETVAGRPDLLARIGPTDIEELLAALAEIGKTVPRLADAKDDRLIAQTVASGADFLVGWDKDLREVDGVRIVSPPEFLRA